MVSFTSSAVVWLAITTTPFSVVRPPLISVTISSAFYERSPCLELDVYVQCFVQ